MKMDVDLLALNDSDGTFKSLREKSPSDLTLEPLLNTFAGKKVTKPINTFFKIISAGDSEEFQDIKPFDQHILNTYFKFNPDLTVPGFDAAIFQDTRLSVPSLKIKFSLGSSSSVDKDGPAKKKRKH
jgi:hypothetical protein